MQSNSVMDSERSSNNPVCFIPDDLIDESLDEWRFSLFGRLNLVELKFDVVVPILTKQWKLKGKVHCIPPGKGFLYNQIR